jgi:hypothetical protein
MGRLTIGREISVAQGSEEDPQRQERGRIPTVTDGIDTIVTIGIIFRIPRYGMGNATMRRD